MRKKYPIPRIDESIEELGKARIYKNLDLKPGKNNIVADTITRMAMTVEEKN